MIACHVVAALMCMRLQVAADDWYEVAEVAGQLANRSVTRVQVLIFNSQLILFLGKLKSRWYGPFTVNKDMKNRAIELYDEEGSELIVNKHRVKPYQKNLLDTNKDDDVTLDDEGEVT
ncbi:hypothetical protein Tco_0548135 [Tanacetum coccineum]